MKIYKSYIVPIKTTKENTDYLFKCNKESAIVWNMCVKMNKELWINEEKQIDRKYLQDNLKGINEVIPAKAVQIIIKKYLGAITGIKNARKQGRTDLKFPWRVKKYYNTIWDKVMIKCDYENDYIYLARPRNLNKIINGKSKANPVKIKVRNLPKNIAYAEVKYDNGLKLALNYWIESEEYEQINSNNVSAIDLGEIHTITSVDDKGDNLIITGRKIRSYHRFRNKELGKLQKKLAKCKKDSRNYKKYRKAIRKLTSKSNLKISHELHKTSKKYTEYAINNNIKTVVIGDLGLFNMKLKNRKNKMGNQQKLIQWQHGQIKNMLTYKLARHGILTIEISEAYTSQTCPECGNKYKPMSRNYICKKCGYEIHRDVLGAYNILSKFLNDGEIKKLNIELKELRYLRIA